MEQLQFHTVYKYPNVVHDPAFDPALEAAGVSKEAVVSQHLAVYQHGIIVIGYSDGRVVLHEVDRHKPPKTTLLGAHEGRVTRLVWYKGGAPKGLLISCSEDRTVIVWDPFRDHDLGHRVQRLYPGGGSLLSLTMTHNTFAVASTDGNVFIYRPQQERFVSHYPYFVLLQRIELQQSWAEGVSLREALDTSLQLFIGTTAGDLLVYEEQGEAIMMAQGSGRKGQLSDHDQSEFHEPPMTPSSASSAAASDSTAGMGSKATKQGGEFVFPLETLPASNSLTALGAKLHLNTHPRLGPLVHEELGLPAPSTRSAALAPTGRSSTPASTSRSRRSKASKASKTSGVLTSAAKRTVRSSLTPATERPPSSPSSRYTSRGDIIAMERGTQESFHLKRKIAKAHRQGITAVQLVSDDSHLVTLSHDCTARVWDLDTWSAIASVSTIRAKRFVCAAWHTLHQELYLIDTASRLVVWNVFMDSCVKDTELPWSEGGITDLRVTRDRLDVYLTYGAGPLVIEQRIWRQRKYVELGGHGEALVSIRLEGSTSAADDDVEAAASHGSGLSERIFSASFDNTLICWDAFDMEKLSERRHIRDNDEIMCMLPVPSLGILALGFESGHLMFWNPDAHFGRSTRGHSNSIVSMYFHEMRGHEYLLTAGYDGKVVVWSIAATQNMQPTVAFTLDPGPSGSDELLAVCFVPLSHSKGLVVAGGNAGFLDVWQFDSGQIICRIPSQPSGLSTLCAAPNKCILTGGNDGTIVQWSLENPSFPLMKSRVVGAHDGAITQLVWVSSSDLVLSCAADGVVKMWDPSLWSTKAKPMPPVKYSFDIGTPCSTVCFLASRNRLLVGTTAGKVVVVPMPSATVPATPGFGLPSEATRRREKKAFTQQWRRESPRLSEEAKAAGPPQASTVTAEASVHSTEEFGKPRIPSKDADMASLGSEDASLAGLSLVSANATTTSSRARPPWQWSPKPVSLGGAAAAAPPTAVARDPQGQARRQFLRQLFEVPSRDPTPVSSSSTQRQRREADETKRMEALGQVEDFNLPPANPGGPKAWKAMAAKTAAAAEHGGQSFGGDNDEGVSSYGVLQALLAAPRPSIPSPPPKPSTIGRGRDDEDPWPSWVPSKSEPNLQRLHEALGSEVQTVDRYQAQVQALHDSLEKHQQVVSHPSDKGRFRLRNPYGGS